MRYKEFNSNKVLENCILLFWKNGFNSCSINEVVSKTGVNRFSLYKEFQDKEGILYSALKLYNDRFIGKKLEILKQRNKLKEVLMQFYESFLSDSNEHPSGCFIIHIATELADSNPNVKLFLVNYLSELEANFISVVQPHTATKSQSLFYAKHLTGLFCTSMCFCVIQTYEERLLHINNGINILLKKK